MNQEIKKNLQWLIMILGMITPALLVLLFPTTYYRDDLADFWIWSQPLKENLRDIYIQCRICAYPLFGTLATGGVISLFRFEEFSQIITPFRLYLAVFDVINVILIYILLKKLEVRNAPLWAGLIGLLPSSWIGSSIWGQIEGLSQLLILSACLILILFNEKPQTVKISYAIFLVFMGGMFSLMLMTKQLILFSLASLALMVIINIILYSHKFLDIVRSLILFLIASITPIVVIDFALILKKNYFSHLQYTLIKGSSIGNIISGNGFNLWAFFVDTPIRSSHLPINIQINAQTVISINPYWAGIILFLLFNSVLALWFFNYFYKNHFVTKIRFFSKNNFLLFMLHIALVNLSFNLFLTGTHERYLYHFYPFVIIAALGLFNQKLVYILFISGTCYAAFVFAHIQGLLSFYGQTPFLIMFAIHFPLLIYLTAFLNKQLKHQPDSA